MARPLDPNDLADRQRSRAGRGRVSRRQCASSRGQGRRGATPFPVGEAVSRKLRPVSAMAWVVLWGLAARASAVAAERLPLLLPRRPLVICDWSSQWRELAIDEEDARRRLKERAWRRQRILCQLAQPTVLAEGRLEPVDLPLSDHVRTYAFIYARVWLAVRGRRIDSNRNSTPPELRGVGPAARASRRATRPRSA